MTNVAHLFRNNKPISKDPLPNVVELHELKQQVEEEEPAKKDFMDADEEMDIDDLDFSPKAKEEEAKLQPVV